MKKFKIQMTMMVMILCLLPALLVGQSRQTFSTTSSSQQKEFKIILPRGQDVAVHDVILEVNYELEGTADLYLNGKRMTEIKGTTKNRARYWFMSRGWGWKLGENILEFRLSKDSSDFKVLSGAVEYSFN